MAHVALWTRTFFSCRFQCCLGIGLDRHCTSLLTGSGFLCFSCRELTIVKLSLLYDFLFVFNYCVSVDEILMIQMNTLTFGLNLQHATARVFHLHWGDWIVDFRPLSQRGQGLFGKSVIQYKCLGKSDSRSLDSTVQVCKEWGIWKKRNGVFCLPSQLKEGKTLLVGLMLILLSVEEWGFSGARIYLFMELFHSRICCLFCSFSTVLIPLKQTRCYWGVESQPGELL